MFSTLIQIALFVVLTVAADSDPVLNTPREVTQCGKFDLTWSGGEGPYHIFAVLENDPCGDSLVDFPVQTGKNASLLAAIPANTVVQFLLEDTTSEAWTGPVKILPSSDASCISQKTLQALKASDGAGSAPGNSSSVSIPTPATTLTLPTIGAAKPAPPGPAAIANAANGSNNSSSSSSSSGAIPRAALPGGFILAMSIFLLALVHR